MKRRRNEIPQKDTKSKKREQGQHTTTPTNEKKKGKNNFSTKI
jgi:hypothetical protein